MYFIGFDVGSSSIKAALVHAETQEVIAQAKYPAIEMEMISSNQGWAEQDPSMWWANVCRASKAVIQNSNINPKEVKSIGIAYQMHGLVLIDKDRKVLRPSIIWCDSRAVEIGDIAFQELGRQHCLTHFLNSPGNFTASKLKWVKNNEPDLYNKIYKILLPGDYIAMKMTNEVHTTISGLSEGILWDFQNNSSAISLLDHYSIDSNLLPECVDTFGLQGVLTEEAALSLGLEKSTPVSYRAGDQPNNALSLGIHKPGQIAATGGTSGVLYGIMDKVVFDPECRVNNFAHVNHTSAQKRIGVLLCINGAGIQYAWLRKHMAGEDVQYDEMEALMQEVPVGSHGLRVLPFGNGAERMFKNSNHGAQVNNLQFNLHTNAHFYRAALEGIAFSFIYGFKLMEEMGIDLSIIKAGNDNLFQSSVFSTTMANLMNKTIEVVDTNGAIGAAKAGGIGLGFYTSIDEAYAMNKVVKKYVPDNTNGVYSKAYELWKGDVEILINRQKENA